jgi:flagellar hook-length control protein FliK
METAALLNISAKEHKRAENAQNKASETEMSGPKRSDPFNMAYKNELKKQSEKTESNDQSERTRQKSNDNGLPQSGNGLPKDQTQVAQSKTDGTEEKSTEQPSAGQSNVQAGEQSKEQLNEQQNNGHSAQVNHLNGSAAAFIEQPDTLESMQVVTTEAKNELASTGQTVTEDLTEAPLSEASQSMVPIMLSGLTPAASAKPEAAIAADKVMNAEVLNGNTMQGQKLAQNNTPLAVGDSAMQAGQDNKKESALGKSVADFQQYIESAKKQSALSEPIKSVKQFDETLKTAQQSAQLLKQELRGAQNPGAQTQGTQILQASLQITSALNMNPAVPSTSATSAAAMQNPAALEVKANVGKSGWGQGFSNQIVMMASKGIQHAKIRLNPMHLGPIEAMVKITGENAVVNLTSLHLTTKEAMDNAVPRLKEMLNENGFSQVDVNVSHQDKKEQQEAGFTLKERSDDEHGNPAMPGEEQLSEVDHESENDMQMSASEQDLNIVDYYA